MHSLGKMSDGFTLIALQPAASRIYQLVRGFFAQLIN